MQRDVFKTARTQVGSSSKPKRDNILNKDLPSPLPAQEDLSAKNTAIK
jgi:hypothetical protein